MHQCQHQAPVKLKFNLTLFIAGIAVVVLGTMLVQALKEQVWLEAFRDAEMIGLILYFAFKTAARVNVTLVMFVFITIHFSGSLIYGLIYKDNLMALSSFVILMGTLAYGALLNRRKNSKN